MVFSAILTVMILQRGFVAVPAPTEPQTVVNKRVAARAGERLPRHRRRPRPTATGGHDQPLPGGVKETGPLGPLEFFQHVEESEVVLWTKQETKSADQSKTQPGDTSTTFTPQPTPGSQVLRPGAKPHVRRHPQREVLRQAELLVADARAVLRHGVAAAHSHPLLHGEGRSRRRKSTIVGIACIGFFYVLTLYMGLGAMTSGALDVTD